MKISVTNLNKAYRINTRMMAYIASRILRYVDKMHGVELELVFLDDAGIRKLNKRYKGRSRATDVLSFSLDRVGLIYVSIDRAADVACEYGAGVADELVRYVIHGILHLFGYDDATRNKRRLMSAKEDEILLWLGRAGTLSKVLTRR